MDPPHITEFASERYFSKLNQLNDAQEQAPDGSASATASASIQASPFILPLRDTRALDGEVGVLRPTEQKRFDRSRFFGFRSKVPLLHSKHATPTVEALPAHSKPIVDPAAHTK